MHRISHFYLFPLQPCEDQISFMHSAKQSNRRKNRGGKGKQPSAALFTPSSIRVSTKTKVGHSKWLYSTVAWRVHLDTPAQYRPAGSCIILSLHDLNYAFSMAPCVKSPHVWDMQRRVKKNQLDLSHSGKPHGATQILTLSLERLGASGLVSCQLCYRVMRKVPLFCPSAVALCHHIIINPL